MGNFPTISLAVSMGTTVILVADVYAVMASSVGVIWSYFVKLCQNVEFIVLALPLSWDIFHFFGLSLVFPEQVAIIVSISLAVQSRSKILLFYCLLLI